MTYLLTLMGLMYDSASNKFSFIVLGSRVCRTAFREFWHTTKYGLELLCRCVRSKRAYPVHGNALLFRDDPQTRASMLYLTRLAHVSEHQPDSEEIHLVERTTKQEIYEGMVAELQPLEDPTDIPSYQTFTLVWRKNFSHLKIPRECRLGRCDVCEDFSEKISKSRGQRRELYRTQKQQHTHQCKTERNEIEAQLARAHTHPDDWTCLATDWCNPHFMPHKSRTPKTWFTKSRLKYHVFGICNYGTKERILYPHFEFWNHNANLHMSFLFCYLRELKEQGVLRKNLMLQMDNCWRDNKNQWFFGFLAHLVDLNWFHLIEIFYLSPGHSHAIVDRECFRPLGRKARSLYSYWTPDEFWTNFVTRAFRRTTKKLGTLHQIVVWDWKEFLRPHLRKIQFHSFQRAFMLQKEDGAAILRFKADILKQNWKGLKNSPENGLQILRSIPAEELPSVILPTPLPEEAFEDVMSLPYMPAHIQNFWENFCTNQFDRSFAMQPEEWADDFWLAEASSDSSIEPSTITEDDVNLEERLIHVVHHPQIIPLIELQKGCIIALRPSEEYYEENPDETREDFWLGQIIRPKSPKVHGNNTIHRFLVAWFANENIDQPNAAAKYILDQDFTNVIHYDAILLHNIELTLQKGLRKADYRKIISQLQ